MVKKWWWLALVMGIGLVVWWANFRSKGEIEYRLVSEIEGVEVEVDMDKFREYLVKLGLEIKPDYQLKLASKNGLNWRKVGRNIRLVELRIRDVGQLQTDVSGKEIVSRFGEARGGKEAVLVTYTWPVEKDGGKKVDFLVYVNTDWYMSESKRQIADKVFSLMILDNFDRGVRLGKEEIKNKIEDRLGGDFKEFIKITKKELGWRLVKPAWGACSGETICEQDVNMFRCQGGFNNGRECSTSLECEGGSCVWTEETYCGTGFVAGIPCVGSTYCAGACPDGFSCDLGGCRQPPYVPPGDPTPTDGPIPTQPPENCLTYGSGAGVVIYVYEDTNGNGKWESGERQIPLNSGDPLLGDAYLEYTGGSCDLGDTPCSGSLTQTSSGKHRLVLAQIPCEYNNPSNKCIVVNPIASEVTNSNPPLELSPVYFDPPNWSGWQYTTLRNTSWGSGSCVAPNEDKCLNDQEFKNIGLNDIYGVGTTQFWYFNITLRTCTTKSASFELKNLPTGVETRRVSQFLTPHNLRSPFGEQYYKQVVAIPIPLKPCVKNCTCESSTCIGSSCRDWCGGQCAGTLAPSCEYSAWSPDSCSPACGQTQTRTASPVCIDASECTLLSQTCGTTDAGAPGLVNIISPAGTVASPTIINNTTTVTLDWSDVAGVNDKYQYQVYNATTGALITSLTTVGLSPSSASFSGSYDTPYYWRVRSVNDTCLAVTGGITYYGSWSGSGYFRFNRSPQLPSETPSPSLVLRNSSSTVVPAEAGDRNQLCQVTFISAGEHDRQARVEIRAVDLDGYDDIENVYFRLGVGNSVAVTDLTTSPLSASTGNWSLYDSVTYSGADTTRVVTFPLEFGAGMNTSSIYDMEMKIDDRWGQSSGWVSASRSFKVWDCLVPLSGTLYDSSDVGGAICLNGTGYSQAYEGTLFTSLAYRQGGGNPVVLPTISGANFDGANLIWGQNYVVDFNDDIDMSDPIAGQRMLDMGVVGGSYVCGQDASFDLDENIVDAYSNVPQLVIDYSGVKDQECWYQVRGGSVLAGDNIYESIPLTCVSSPGCINALNIDNTGMDDNGLVLTNSKTNIVGCSDCLSGHDNDWYKTGYNQNMKVKNYQEMYRDLYVSKGVGRLAVNWLEVLDAGGTGLVFVDGDLTIESNNSLTDNQFLMVVVSGSINIDDGVNQTEGVFQADGDLIIEGESNLALEINGMVYANDIQISRSFSNRADNNANPAVLFNYNPRLIFKAPVYMFEKLYFSR